MTTTISPLAEPATTTDARPARQSPSPVASGPARGIAMGAALSAPMWIGILYLLRMIASSL